MAEIKEVDRLRKEGQLSEMVVMNEVNSKLNRQPRFRHNKAFVSTARRNNNDDSDGYDPDEQVRLNRGEIRGLRQGLFINSNLSTGLAGPHRRVTSLSLRYTGSFMVSRIKTLIIIAVLSYLTTLGGFAAVLEDFNRGLLNHRFSDYAPNSVSRTGSNPLLSESILKGELEEEENFWKDFQFPSLSPTVSDSNKLSRAIRGVRNSAASVFEGIARWMRPPEDILAQDLIEKPFGEAVLLAHESHLFDILAECTPWVLGKCMRRHAHVEPHDHYELPSYCLPDGIGAVPERILYLINDPMAAFDRSCAESPEKGAKETSSSFHFDQMDEEADPRSYRPSHSFSESTRSDSKRHHFRGMNLAQLNLLLAILQSGGYVIIERVPITVKNDHREWFTGVRLTASGALFVGKRAPTTERFLKRLLQARDAHIAFEDRLYQHTSSARIDRNRNIPTEPRKSLQYEPVDRSVLDELRQSERFQRFMQRMDRTGHTEGDFTSETAQDHHHQKHRQSMELSLLLADEMKQLVDLALYHQPSHATSRKNATDEEHNEISDFCYKQCYNASIFDYNEDCNCENNELADELQAAKQFTLDFLNKNKRKLIEASKRGTAVANDFLELGKEYSTVFYEFFVNKKFGEAADGLTAILNHMMQRKEDDSKEEAEL